MSAINGFELDPTADRAAFAAPAPAPLRLAGAYPLPDAAEVAAVYRRTADLYAARVRLMPAVW
jgi:hypothetical protein